MVTPCFEEYNDWILLIHDNMLVLANTSEELFEKIKLIVRRCFKHDMFVKMWKSKFYGYECEKSKFRIDERRRACKAYLAQSSYALVSSLTIRSGLSR